MNDIKIEHRIKKMRLFIAISLSPDMKDSLINIQNSFYNAGIRGNYTAEENLHLTLVFIGEYPNPQNILDALEGISFVPFTLSLGGIGLFRDLWWAEIESSPALDAVVRRIKRALAENGIPFDKKRFFPHITLLRKASASMLPSEEIRSTSMTVNEITLFRSDRGKNRMIYTEVGRITPT